MRWKSISSIKPTLDLLYALFNGAREIMLLGRQLSVANKRIKQLEAFVNRFLNPEDLGYTVNHFLRDDAREALEMKRVESLNKDNCT